MRSVLGALVVSIATLVMLRASAGCESSGEPDCRDNTCVILTPDSGSLDGAPITPTDDGSVVTPPEPFDAGVPQPPPCKGLFELCTSTECCAPYGCTNGSCR